MEVVQKVNKYITEKEPWMTIKTDTPATTKVLWTMANCVYNLNKMLSPFLPTSANLVDKTLGQKHDYAESKIEEVSDLDDKNFKYPIITNDYSKHRIWEYSDIELTVIQEKPSPIFNKISDEQIDNEYNKIIGNK
jgi:methionyl-tRNA synthetase